MLFVLPATSILLPTSYPAPQRHEYPNHAFYNLYPNASQPGPSTYPTPRQHFFGQPSVEELEEREYQQALTVIYNYRRQQAEKEVTTRRQQRAEAARRRYLASMAKDLAQRRQQEELLATGRAQALRTQWARDRLATAERQIAVDGFLRQLKGPQLEAIRQPHVARRRIFPDAPRQNLAGGSDANITEPIRDTLSAFDSRPARSEDKDSAKLVENFISSLFPGLVSHARSTASAETTQPKIADNGNGKAKASDDESKDPVRKPWSPDVSSAPVASKSSSVVEPTPSAGPFDIKVEQTEVDRAATLLSVENIRSDLIKLQTNFVLPAELDHYSPSTDDRDETVSVSSVSSGDITKLVPYTSINKPVYKYEHALNGLLEQLDGIDSHGDEGVRDKRKEVVKAVERALEEVERAVGEAVEKRLSLAAATTEEQIKGYEIYEDTAEGDPASAVEQVDTSVPVEDVAPEQSTAVQSEAGIPTSVGDASPAEETVPESNSPMVSDDAIVVPSVESLPTEPDSGPSTWTATPGLAKPGVTEHKSTEPPTPADVPETVDTFSLPKKAFPPLPVRRSQDVSSGIDDEILVLDSDDSRSDWSEVEN